RPRRGLRGVRRPPSAGPAVPPRYAGRRRPLVVAGPRRARNAGTHRSVRSVGEPPAWSQRGSISVPARAIAAVTPPTWVSPRCRGRDPGRRRGLWSDLREDL